MSFIVRSNIFWFYQIKFDKNGLLRTDLISRASRPRFEDFASKGNVMKMDQPGLIRAGGCKRAAPSFSS